MKKSGRDVLIVGIVVFLVGILLLLFLPKYIDKRVDENIDSFIEDSLDGLSRAQDIQRISDLSDIALALELYYQDNGKYPPSLQDGISNYFDSGILPSDPFGGSYYYELCGELEGETYGYALATEVENPKSSEDYFVGDFGDELVDPTTCELVVEEAELDNPGNLYLIYRK